MAFANQYGIDMQGIGQQWAADDQASLRKQLGGYQLKAAQREEENQNALKQYLPAAMGGDTEAAAKVTAANPTFGLGLMGRQAEIAKAKRDQAMKEAPIYGRAFQNVSDQASYDSARAALSGLGIGDAEKLPPQYDPAIVSQIQQRARAMTAPDLHIGEGPNGPYALDKNNLTVTPIPGVGAKPDTEVGRLMAARDRLPPGHPARGMYDQAINKATGGAEDKALVEVYDENSPTGTRFVPRAQAVGMPGKAANGLAFRTNADGTVEVVQGRGAGMTDSGLAKPTVNKLEENSLAASEQLARLGAIEQAYKPEYQQIATRGANWWASIKAKAGADLDPQSRKGLEDYTAYKRDTVANLNQTIKDITGAAMSDPEARRIMSQVPNAGQGVFDGDSPPEFEAKLKGATAAARNALIRANWARSKGMDPLKTGVSLDEVPAMVDKRGAQIEKDMLAKNPNADKDTIRETVRIQLGKEFGLYK